MHQEPEHPVAFHYHASKGRSLHLPRKDDFRSIPMDLLNDLGGFTGLRFVQHYELNDGHEHVRQDFEQHGYHISRDDG